MRTFVHLKHLQVYKNAYNITITTWGRPGFDGGAEAKVAGRGAAGLVKSGKLVIANNDYEYAYAA